MSANNAYTCVHMDKNWEDHILIEYHRVGDAVKVSAVDANTGREVSVVVPAKGLTQQQMNEVALKKLRYVLEKESS